MIRGLHHESATHSEYTYEPTINISATLATSAQDGIRLDYVCRIGVKIKRISEQEEKDEMGESQPQIDMIARCRIVFSDKPILEPHGLYREETKE